MTIKYVDKIHVTYFRTIEYDIPDSKLYGNKNGLKLNNIKIFFN